jgi:hypothetical protein
VRAQQGWRGEAAAHRARARARTGHSHHHHTHMPAMEAVGPQAALPDKRIMVRVAHGVVFHPNVGGGRLAQAVRAGGARSGVSRCRLGQAVPRVLRPRTIFRKMSHLGVLFSSSSLRPHSARRAAASVGVRGGGAAGSALVVKG